MLLTSLYTRTDTCKPTLRKGLLHCFMYKKYKKETLKELSEDYLKIVVDSHYSK